MPPVSLFPPIEPYETGRLHVDGGHSLYWEQCGNPHGVPVLFLHGGPGAGASPTHRRFFDPEFYRIVILDQRGAGRSTPLGSVAGNTTANLIADLEALRQVLKIDSWLVFGGSWGSTLALAYAEAHPERCRGLILRGIFLMRRREVDWFLHDMGTIFPEAYARFVEHIPATERGDLLEAYWRRLDSPKPEIRLAAARVWSDYESACSTLYPQPETPPGEADDRHALGLARIEAHYFRSEHFAPDDRLLADLGRIRHLPAVIVQGRYDIICPIVTADELHRAWPEAEYVVVADAGHAAMEPGIRTALLDATERFKERLR